MQAGAKLNQLGDPPPSCLPERPSGRGPGQGAGGLAGPIALQPTEMAAPPARTIAGLVQEHFSFVWRSLRRFGLSEADADDAAQQVFLVLDRKLSEITPGRERAFLFGAAAKIASRARRTIARRRENPEEPRAHELHDSAPCQEDVLAQRRASHLLNEILESMPEDVRAVFILYELEQLTMAEISDVLGARPGTVASRLRRARELFEKGIARLKARTQYSGGVS